MRATMSAARTTDAVYRLNARPPCANGLSRKSPTVAPSGLVRMKAAQNRSTSDLHRWSEYLQLCEIAAFNDD